MRGGRYRRGYEGTVAALGGTEGQTDEQVLPAFSAVKGCLLLHHSAYEFDICAVHVHRGEQLPEIPTGGLFRIGKLGGAYARQRAVREAFACRTGEQLVHGELGGAPRIALEFHVVVRCAFKAIVAYFAGMLYAVHICASAVKIEIVRYILVFAVEKAHHVHHFGDEPLGVTP